ncbi:hypothetical protein [Nocardiopsis sp. Huas11]|nr:hypothetical protein [Nocardiopsis sp. Huas11]
MADEWFTATIDAHAEGLSAYLRDAFAADADRQEARKAREDR